LRSAACAATQDPDRRFIVKAVVNHGPRQGSVDEVPDARIEKPTDALVNCYTSSAPTLETSFWQPGLLTEYIASEAGHSINVDYGAPAFYAQTLLWLQLHNL
jgi:hypothetical protein